LAANAIKAFQKVDIADEVIQCGRLMLSFTLYDQSENPITKTDSKAMGEKYEWIILRFTEQHYINYYFQKLVATLFIQTNVLLILNKQIVQY